MRQYRNIVFEGACNISCLYCEPKEAHVNQKIVINSIRDIFRSFEGKHVSFRLECDGEITLYPEIINYLNESVLQYGFPIEVISNGVVAKQYVKTLKNLRWVFSLDGHTEKMCVKRGLKQAEIEDILESILMSDAEIQLVYHGQPIEEVNEFIRLLEQRGYNGFLHIFPEMSIRDGSVLLALDYRRLYKANFLPKPDFFERWEYIYEHKKRNFVCDQLTNGYTYQIDQKGNIELVKCDSISSKGYTCSFEMGEIEFDDFPCKTCICHLEYNNSRAIVKSL